MKNSKYKYPFRYEHSTIRKISTLKNFVSIFWFIPSDVLQRGIEAVIWGGCSFRSPTLEIGVGNGEVSKLLFDGKNIDVGIDINTKEISKARKLQVYKKVFAMNAERMTFQNSSFNTVISNSTFEHILNDERAISEVGRVLRKNGLFFNTSPTDLLAEWITEFEESKNSGEGVKKLRKFNKRVQHYHYRSLLQWIEICKKNKMEIIFYKYYFPKKTALMWYKIFKVFTYKLRKRELWSYLGQSRLTAVVPKKIFVWIELVVLGNVFKKSLFAKDLEGGQVFIVAKKI